MAKTAAWTRSEGKNKTGGLNAKGVASYRAANPGSKLKTAVTTKPQPTSNKPTVAPKQSIRDPEDYSDNFYGNQYTGSLGKGASLGDVDLGINFNQSGLKTIGKTIGAVKAAAKPFSNLATAFKAGMSKAPSKRQKLTNMINKVIAVVTAK